MTAQHVRCKNCGHQFSGMYCNLCGEKIVQENDFKLSTLVGQAFGAFTNFDSKLWNSIKWLATRPGTMALHYVNGLRKPYVKPFQLFLIANVLFFIFLADNDVFRSPSKWYFQRDFDGINVLEKVEAIAAAKEVTIREIAIQYDQLSSDLAKGLLILFTPIIGFIFWALHAYKKWAFGKHMIAAVYYFSLFLLTAVILFGLLSMTHLKMTTITRIIFAIPILLYIFLVLKGFYREKWWWALMKSVVVLIALLFLLNAYRSFINQFTLWLL